MTSRGFCSQQPACAEFICRKLFRHFVSETQAPSEALIAPLARAFRESHYQIKVPVAMILRSNLFFDPSVRRRRVKSPVEFAVGTIRALEIVKPTVQSRGPGRGLRPDGPEPVRAAERRGLGRRARLDQLDRDAGPGQSGARLALRSERRTRASGATPGRWPAGMVAAGATRSPGSSSICWPPAHSSPKARQQIEKAAANQEFRRRRRGPRSGAPDPDFARISACVNRPWFGEDIAMSWSRRRFLNTSLSSSTLVAMGATTIPTFLGRSAAGRARRPSRMTGSWSSCSSWGGMTA